MFFIVGLEQIALFIHKNVSSYWWKSGYFNMVKYPQNTTVFCSSTIFNWPESTSDSTTGSKLSNLQGKLFYACPALLSRWLGGPLVPSDFFRFFDSLLRRFARSRTCRQVLFHPYRDFYGLRSFFPFSEFPRVGNECFP